jgi:hypothetical protein
LWNTGEFSLDIELAEAVAPAQRQFLISLFRKSFSCSEQKPMGEWLPAGSSVSLRREDSQAILSPSIFKSFMF